MKKVKFFILIFFLFGPLILFNDVNAQQLVFSISCGQTLSGRSTSTQEYFNFTLSSPQTVTITVTPSLLSLYDLIVKWDGSYPSYSNFDCYPGRPTGQPQTCSYTNLPSGTYYIMTDNIIPGTYSLSLNCDGMITTTTHTSTATTTTSTVTTIASCGSCPGGVCSISCGQTLSGRYTNTKEYFRFNLDTPRSVAITATPSSSSLYDLLVKWSLNTCPSTSVFDCYPGKATGQPQTCSYTNLPSGTYYIMTDNIIPGTYSLSLSCSGVTITTTTATTTTSTTTGSTSASTTTIPSGVFSISCGQTLSGRSTSTQEYFNFTLSSTRDVTITVKPSSTALYDLIVKWDGSYPSYSNFDCYPGRPTGQPQTCSYTNLPSGTYYIMTDNIIPGTYSLSLSCSGVTITTTTATTTTSTTTGSTSASTTTIPSNIGWLHTSGTRILNANNEEVIWNGIGTGLAHWNMYGAELILHPSDVQSIRSHGLNSIRLGFNIDNMFYNQPKPTSPTQLTYWPDFWGHLDTIVEACRANGIWVWIDYHPNQLFSTRWVNGGGTGFPTWTVDGSWSFQTTNFGSDDEAYKAFWNLSDARMENVRTLYKTLWRDIANRYKSYGNVVFNLWNEPMMDKNFWTSPAERTQFATYYRMLMEQTIDNIQAVDGGTHVIVIDQAYWSGNWSMNEKVNRANVVVSRHLYANHFTGTTIPIVLTTQAEYAWRYNQPIIWGEFGLYEGGGKPGEPMTLAQITEFIQISHTLKKLDLTTQPVGWVYWSYNNDPNAGGGQIIPYPETWQILEGNLYPNLKYYL